MRENVLTESAEKQNITFEEAIQEFLVNHRPHIKVKRPGTVEEAASAVLYLASTNVSFINGVKLRIDGGQQRVNKIIYKRFDFFLENLFYFLVYFRKRLQFKEWRN